VREEDDRIVIKARDAAGNESEEVVIRVDKPYPTIAGLTPVVEQKGQPWEYVLEQDPTVLLILVQPDNPGETTMNFEMGTDESQFSNEYPRNPVQITPYLLRSPDPRRRQRLLLRASDTLEGTEGVRPRNQLDQAEGEEGQPFHHGHRR